MSKTPEEYFQEQSFSVPGNAGGGDFSAAELTFIRKYMGLDAPDTLRRIGLGKKADQIESVTDTAQAEQAKQIPIDSLQNSLDLARPEAVAQSADEAELPPGPKKLADVLGPEETALAASGKVETVLAPVLEDVEEPAASVQSVPVVQPVVDAAPAQPEPAVQPVAPVAEISAPAKAPAAPAAPVAEAAAPAQVEVEAPAAKTAAPAQDQTEDAKRPTIADIYEGMDVQAALGHFLRNEPELQMVGFYLSGQEFTVPTVIVQEVIHYTAPTKLPLAPPYVAGAINLRGKVTPLVHLREILEVNKPRQNEDRFIIICRFQGFQVGLLIERVHTMYRVPQKDIDWGIEAHLGINVDYVSGLLKLNEHLVGIVAVDKIVNNLLQDEQA
ncbi:MAG: chemotaxis protein CheW [Deltaproteobacteria bacterium]|jgi:purine-binding chemotaxis protein CheW|nr:chemotaxis protein CheW [Deltaproteobacteria bacterium]